MMIRNTNTRDRVRVLNAVIRPNIWLQKDREDGVEKRIFSYGAGSCKVVVSGTLLERDFGTWLTMLEMSRQNDNQKWDSDQILIDIAKQMGVKNPWHKRNSLWDSFDRLLDTQIRIRPEKGKGLTARFNLIEGYVKEDGSGSFSVSQYMDIVKGLLLGQTLISKEMYFKINGSLASSLYRFLSSQQPFYNGSGYEIRLSLLCKYLNYDINERPWWQILPHIKNAIEELKKVNFIGRYKYEKKRQKIDGGVLILFPVKKPPKELTTGETNNEIIKLIQGFLSEKISWTEDNTNKIKSGINQTAKFLKQYDHSLKYIIEDYCQWIINKDLKFIVPTIFNPDNFFFQEYIKSQLDNGNLGTIQENKKELNKPKPKPMSEKEKKDLEKSREEYQLKRQKRLESLKCPHGGRIGIDYNLLNECYRCEFGDFGDFGEYGKDECEQIKRQLS